MEYELDFPIQLNCKSLKINILDLILNIETLLCEIKDWCYNTFICGERVIISDVL